MDSSGPLGAASDPQARPDILAPNQDLWLNPALPLICPEPGYATDQRREKQRLVEGGGDTYFNDAGSGRPVYREALWLEARTCIQML